MTFSGGIAENPDFAQKNKKIPYEIPVSRENSVWEDASER
jgi:hypothetical protein